MKQVRWVVSGLMLGLLVVGCGRKEKPAAVSETAPSAAPVAEPAKPPVKEVPQVRAPLQIWRNAPGEFKRLVEAQGGTASYQAMLLSVASKADSERLPSTQIEKLPQGLRVTQNAAGGRYRFDLVGKVVQQVSNPGPRWLVDGIEIRNDVRPVPPDYPTDPVEIMRRDQEHSLRELTTLKWQLVEGGVQNLKTSTGQPLYYSEAMPQQGAPNAANFGKLQVAVTVANRSLVQFCCSVPAGADGPQSRDLVRRTAQSVEVLPDLPPDKAPLTVVDLVKTGLTLKQTLTVLSAVSSPTGALVSTTLASPQDRKLDGVTVLEPKQLLRCLGMYLVSEHGDIDVDGGDADWHRAYTKFWPQAIVFDGSSAHTIALVEFDRKTGAYVFDDPWNGVAFLGQGSNKAAVAAKPHGSDRRHFSVTPEELLKVVYAVTFFSSELGPMVQLVEALDKPAEQAVAAAGQIKPQAADPKLLTAKRFLGAGKFCLWEKDAPTAAKAFRICLALEPTSVEATIGLADACQLQGDRQGAAKLYREAQNKLAQGGQSFSPAKKERLDKHVQQHLTEVQASAR